MNIRNSQKFQRHIAALLVVLLLLVGGVRQATPTNTAYASDPAITATSSEARVSFPRNITFLLEAESSAAPISEVSLLYGAERSDVMTIVETETEPGQRVNVRYMLNTQVFYQPPGIDLVYQWIIRDEAGNELETEPQTLVYHDDRFDWQERNQRGVTVYWYEGGEAFGDQLIGTATATLDRLEREIGATVEEPVKIYVYASIRDMRSALRSNEVEWVGGEARPSLGLILGAIPPGNDSEIGRLIPHELSHQVLHQATENPYGGVPLWFNEGLAVHNQETVEISFDLYLEAAARNGELIPLEALSASFPTDPEQALLSYAQSHSIVAYLIEQYGTEATQQLVAAFAEAMPLEQALQEAIGLTVDELDAEWRETLPRPTTTEEPSAEPRRSAPPDRFQGNPVLPSQPVSGSPPSQSQPGVSFPPSGLVAPQAAPPQAPMQKVGIVLPLWAEIGLALGCCTVMMSMVGVSLLVILRLAGGNRQVR